MTEPVAVARADVRAVLEQLLTGELSRRAASDWAASRHVEEHPDPAVEEALDVLVLVDAVHLPPDGDYLYDLTEAAAALKSLQE